AIRCATLVRRGTMKSILMHGSAADRLEHSHMRFRAVVAVALSVICLASCARQPDTTLMLSDALVVDMDGARAVAFDQLSAAARCMADLGFEYVPYVGTNDDPSFFQRYSAYSTSSDFLREHGYGLVLQYQNGLQHARSDPNQEIVSRLSAADRDAYYEALVGEHGDGGCIGSALGSRLAAIDQFGLKIGEMMDHFAQDERVIDANRDWAACMNLQSLQYASPEGAKTDIANRMGSLNADDLDSELENL